MGVRGGTRTAVVLAAVAAAMSALVLVDSIAGAEPPLPEAADPAAAVASPVADEVPPCGYLSVGLVAVDLGVGAVTPAVGPVLPGGLVDLIVGAYNRAFLAAFDADSAACDALPARQFTSTCDADDRVASTMESVPIPALPVGAGLVPVPARPALVGAIVDTFAAIERAASREAGPSASVAGPLGCETVERVAAGPPGIGSVDVDLTPPRTNDTAAAGTNSGDGSAVGTQVLGSHRTAAAATGAVSRPGAAPTVVASGAPADAAADVVPASAATGDDSTRRNVYFVLFLLTAAAAAFGWSRKPVDTTT